MNFRSFLFSSACGLALAAGHAHAADPSNVQKFNSVDDFRSWAMTASSSDFTNLPSFHLAAYYCRNGSLPNCPADGGEGLFVRQSQDCTSASVDDGGSLLVVDKAPAYYCYYRQNLNGDIRQFGVTLESEFDCDPNVNSAATCAPITAGTMDHPAAPWPSLLAAADAAGLTKLTTAGVQLKIGETVTIPKNTDLDMGGSPLGARTSLLNVPGTMFVAHGATLAMTDHSSVHHGMLLPAGYIKPTDEEGIGGFYRLRDDMVTDGDTGLTCDGSGCDVHDFDIYGFDTAYDAKGGVNRATNVTADGDVCFYLHDMGGGTKWVSAECVSNYTRGNFPNQEYFQITGLTEGTGGTCRVTVETLPGETHAVLTDIDEDFLVWGSGLNEIRGGLNANDRFRAGPRSISGDSLSFDLKGSLCADDSAGSFVGPTTTATWKAHDNKITVASIDQIHPGMTISGVADIVDGTKVLSVWRGKNIVILDTPTGGTAHLNMDVSFRSLIPTDFADCDENGNGACITLDASARVDVGDSLGGVAASRNLDMTTGSHVGKATGFLIGGAFKNDTTVPEVHDRDEVAGFTSWGSGVWGRAIDYRIWNSNFSRISGAAGDAEGSYDDPNTTFLRIDGDSNNASFVGGKGGKSGTGVVVNTHLGNQCLSYVASSAPVTLNPDTEFEVDAGCFIAQGMRPGGGNGYVADAASHVDLTGSYLLDTNLYYESPTAQGNTTTLGATVSSGANNLINMSIDPDTNVQTPAPAPTVGTDLHIVQADGDQARLLQDSFGKESIFTGRRANGTNAAPSALIEGDVIASFEGIGRTDTGYAESGTGGLNIEACDDWTSSSTCTADVFNATEKGQTGIGETARVESAGLGIGTGEGVHAPLEVLNKVTTAVSSNISLRTNTTGNINVGSNADFPSPGVLLVDGELMSYTRSRTVGSRLTLTGRGLWGTTAVTHADNSTLRVVNLLVADSTSTPPQFAVTSDGGVWHLTTSGAPPALSDMASGGTIAGNDNAGRIVLPASLGAGTGVTLTFKTPWANAPVCFAQDEKDKTKNPWIAHTVSTTAVTFESSTVPSGSDVLSYTCTGFK